MTADLIDAARDHVRAGRKAHAWDCIRRQLLAYYPPGKGRIEAIEAARRGFEREWRQIRAMFT